MDATKLQAQIDKLNAQLAAIDVVINKLLDGQLESYTLDTGQSRQNVTKLSIDKLFAWQDKLLNLCSTLQTRLDGNGVRLGRCAW